MERAFSRKAAKSVQDSFSYVRELRKKPRWLGESVYAELVKWWETEDFGDRSKRAKANQSSDRGPAKNTGGSISASTHLMRMTEELKRPPSHLELFKKLHTKQGKWVDRRSQSQQEKYDAAALDKAKELGVQPDELDNDIQLDLWKKTAGANKKGQIYGMTYHGEGSTSSMGRSHKFHSHYQNSLQVESLQNEVRDVRSELKETRELLKEFMAIVKKRKGKGKRKRKRKEKEKGLAPSTGTTQSNEDDRDDGGEDLDDEPEDNV